MPISETDANSNVHSVTNLNSSMTSISGSLPTISPNGIINLEDVPITVIRPKCRQLLSNHLNKIKVIRSEEGLPRDWRGVLHCIMPKMDISLFMDKSNPIGEVFDLWIKERRDFATLGHLQRILGNIDRWDVIDDASDYFVEDARAYLTNKAKQEKQQQLQEQQVATIDNVPNVYVNPEANILTIDDASLAQQGLGPQQYDAFVLFADEDIDFATEIIEKMEEFGFKLCVKERDLIGGSFEHEAILRMISERCERLIVVISPAFFKSPANTFFVNFAQALGIQQCQRKIIPCLFEPCQLPPSLSYYFVLVYKRASKYWNFWDKLRDSLQKSPPQIVVNQMNSDMPRITITEVESTTPIRPHFQQHPQAQQAIMQTPNGISQANGITSQPRKRKDKAQSPALNLQMGSASIKSKGSKGSKPSTPTTPTGLKRFWPPSPKLRTTTMSSSMWTLAVENANLDKENERSRSTISLNSPSSSPTTLHYKKPKWYKKLLSPNSGSMTIKLSTESDSPDMGTTDKTRKKKKWYRKRFSSKTRLREPQVHEV